MKKIFIGIALIGIILNGVYAMAQEEKFSMLKFMMQRQGLKYTKVPHKVLAFYYPWYGSKEFHKRWVHWDRVDTQTNDIASSTHYPLLGAYDSYDTKIIDNHFEMAKGCGIDGMIASWWGVKDYTDKPMPLILDRAKLKGLEVTVYFEAVRGKTTEQKVKNTVKDLSYVVDSYGSHPAFLKVDGKPVIFIYGRAMGQATLSEWSQIIAEMNKKYPKGVALIADGFGGDVAKVFDGMHIYNAVGLAAGKKPEDIDAATRSVFGGWVSLSRKESRICCVDIIPGYDDTKIRKPGLKAERLDGQTYNIMWKNAIASDPDWILITTWNEWHEGSEIEPSVEFGDAYIKITAEYAPAFKQKPYAEVKPGTAAKLLHPPIFLSVAKRNVQNKFKGVKVGLLPDLQSKILQWLVKAELDFRELEWQDLLDAGKFNAKTMPVIIYAGGEGYVQTLKEKCDIDSAILKYLNEGGLMVAASSLPFPFYYNEEGKPVVNAANKFGIPICGSGANDRNDYIEGNVRGWENPPVGIPMDFRLDKTVFKKAQNTIPFPVDGDLRWRPAINKTLSDKDIYQGLARLYDRENIWFGDGIAYIEHRETEPKNGKIVYVWFRMLDAEDADMMLYELFDFIGAKVKK